MVEQFQSLWSRAGSFDVQWLQLLQHQSSFNPFGAGRCLSTAEQAQILKELQVSIPLEQGGVFRHWYPC